MNYHSRNYFLVLLRTIGMESPITPVNMKLKLNCCSFQFNLHKTCALKTGNLHQLHVELKIVIPRREKIPLTGADAVDT
jgi:hypothetical protein